LNYTVHYLIIKDEENNNIEIHSRWFMKNTKVIVSKGKVEEYAGDLLVILVAKNEDGTYDADESIRSLLESLGQYSEFSGKLDEQLQLYPPYSLSLEKLKCSRLLLLGLGCVASLRDIDEKKELLRSVGGAISTQCEKLKVVNVGICISEYKGLSEVVLGECLCEGVLLGDYRFLKYKTKSEDNSNYQGLKRIELVATRQLSAIRRSGVKAGNCAKSVIMARDMANEPGNGWTPSHFANFALEIASKHDLRCTVFEKKDMLDLGMGGIIAVNKGSEELPKVVILEYEPERIGETILLVGKGLTFDSGGVSLKPAQGMMDMKYDMCGGAAVLAAMDAVAREKPAVKVVAIVPATDNMPGGNALKPGDIITQFGGMTTEIESTDAEGRLILADALAYGIETFHPNCVIDLATLTGSVVTALGHHYAGLMSNSGVLADMLITIGKSCGEPLWRLPLGEAYSKQIKSQVADIKNTGGKPAGCLTAAEYLHHFVGKTPWAHLDIAGTAWNFTEKTYIPKGPSGFGVRILIEFIRRWENLKLSNALQPKNS
jgi:leucyl aminopeptidase